MTQASDITQKRGVDRLGTWLAERRGVVYDYLSAISGAGGRLVFSLIYFIALANTLSIAEFGMFATASAAGVMLSRVLAFGFISALYRTATKRPNLIGTFTAGFIVLSLLSLPVLAAASYGVYLLFFAASMALPLFAAVVFAEALLWRPVEVAMIVNNGLGKFGRAALLSIISAPTPPRCCLPSACSTRASGSDYDWKSIGAGSPIPSMSPARKCCSTCRWNSTSCSCWRSAARIWPASTPSSCGWST